MLPKLRPKVCFRHLRWIGERRWSSSLVRVRVLRGDTRVALHPSGCSTQPGGYETCSTTPATFAGLFPAQRTTPQGMLFRIPFRYGNTVMSREFTSRPLLVTQSGML